MRFRLVAPIALIVALNVALIAAGCSSSGSGGRSHTSVISAPPTATTLPVTSHPPSPPTPSVATSGPNVRPGEKPPVLPEVAKKNSRIGSDYFARYWIESLDWGYATTDSTLARSIYAGTCTGCARFLKNIIDFTRDHDQHFVGGRISVVASNLQPPDDRYGATAVVDLTVTQTALRVLDSSGRVVGKAPEVEHGVFRTWLRWSRGHWVVVDWKKAVSR